MQRAAVDALDPTHPAEGVARHDLTAALDAETIAVNRYRIAPGEGLPAGLHAHRDQEEIFVVLDGTATFERLAPDQDAAEEIAVAAGEAVRFAPGEFQSGRNGGDGDLVALAVGAPRDSDDVRIPVACPACGRDDLRLDAGPAGVSFACPACGAEYVPAPCPACGAEDLRVALGDGATTVVGCRECGGEFDRPPMRG